MAFFAYNEFWIPNHSDKQKTKNRDENNREKGIETEAQEETHLFEKLALAAETNGTETETEKPKSNEAWNKTTLV